MAVKEEPMAESVLEADVAKSRNQMQELVDRSEIADLVSRLGLWLDEKRFDYAPSIFVEDATATGRRSGRT